MKRLLRCCRRSLLLLPCCRCTKLLLLLQQQVSYPFGVLLLQLPCHHRCCERLFLLPPLTALQDGRLPLRTLLALRQQALRLCRPALLRFALLSERGFPVQQLAARLCLHM